MNRRLNQKGEKRARAQTRSCESKEFVPSRQQFHASLWNRVAVVEPNCAWRDSEPVELRRVVDQDLLAHIRIRRPYRKLVEQAAVVDLIERRDVGGFASLDTARIRVRPVRTPDDAVRIRSDQCARIGRHVLIVGRELRGAIGAGNLDIGLAGFHQRDQVGKSRLLQPKRGLKAAEMVEYNGYWRRLDEVLD